MHLEMAPRDSLSDLNGTRRPVTAQVVGGILMTSAA